MMSAEISPTDKPQTRRALTITVLAGGPSAEREVSLDSGAAVADALRRRGHDVTIADASPDDFSALDRDVDLVFPTLHGTFGEDGTLQAELEKRGLRFVGSNAAASRIGMDKWATKQVAQDAGFKAPAATKLERGQNNNEKFATLPLPGFVKPVAEGSSVMTTKVTTRDELTTAANAVIDKYGAALVEQYIAGREITVGIIGRTPLPPIWVKPAAGFYDYDAKYRKDDTEYLFDCGLTPAQQQRLHADSLNLFDAIGCRHLARVDWIVDDADTAWLLEINTIPGFTSHSLVGKAAAHTGLAFDDFVERLVWIAMEDDA